MAAFFVAPGSEVTGLLLAFPGTNRHDANGYCQTCHNPSLTDERVRPEGTGAPESADSNSALSDINSSLCLFVSCSHSPSLLPVTASPP